jgi:hypothetical protein
LYDGLRDISFGYSKFECYRDLILYNTKIWIMIHDKISIILVLACGARGWPGVGARSAERERSIGVDAHDLGFMLFCRVLSFYFSAKNKFSSIIN